MSGIHSDDMVVRNRELLTTGEYADMTIICGGGTFRLHRFIMCSASGFFKAACEDNFMEGQTKVINLVEDNIEPFKRMLSYLYILDYEDRDGVNFLNMTEPVCAEDSPPKPSESTEAEGGNGRRNLRRHWRQDPTLRRQARRQYHGFGSDNDSDFESDFESDIERDFYKDSELDYATSETDEEICEAKQAQLRMLNNVDVYALAEKYNLPGLKELAAKKFRRDACKCPLKGLAAIARETYTSTPSSDRGMRDLVIQICETHLDQIMEARDLEVVMEENEDFGADMFKVVRGKYKKQLEVNENLRSKVRTKKQKVGSLMIKKRDLREKFNAKDRMMKYMKTQHENLTEAYDFASWQVHMMYRDLPFSCKEVMKCERCKQRSPETLTWADKGEHPYLELTCDDCNWRSEQDSALYGKLKAISLKDLDFEWKWRHGGL